MTRDRRKSWGWMPPDCLAELKAMEDEADEITQASAAKRTRALRRMTAFWQHALELTPETCTKIR